MLVSDSSSASAEQLAYYRAGADEYEDHSIDVPGQDELLAAIDSFRPTGDVLEVACGSGIWTQLLLRSAVSVTAVDGAPKMLRRARNRVGIAALVRYIEADLLAWRADRRYDGVFFGFWISHVPEDKFTSFWSTAEVRDTLARSQGDLLSYVDEPEALEWRQSTAAREASGATGGADRRSPRLLA